MITNPLRYHYLREQRYALTSKTKVIRTETATALSTDVSIDPVLAIGGDVEEGFPEGTDG